MKSRMMDQRYNDAQIQIATLQDKCDRLEKLLSEQKDHTDEICLLKEQIDIKNQLIEEQRRELEKCMAVIRCTEAFVGQNFFY